MNHKKHHPCLVIISKFNLIHHQFDHCCEIFYEILRFLVRILLAGINHILKDE